MTEHTTDATGDEMQRQDPPATTEVAEATSEASAGDQVASAPVSPDEAERHGEEPGTPEPDAGPGSVPGEASLDEPAEEPAADAVPAQEPTDSDAAPEAEPVVAAQPDVAPDAEPTEVAQPDATDDVVAEPGRQESAAEPVPAEEIASGPVVDQDAAAEPVAADHAVAEPVTEDAGAEPAAADESDAQPAVGDEPVAEPAAADEAAAEQAGTDDVAVEPALAGEATAQRAVTEAIAAEPVVADDVAAEALLPDGPRAPTTTADGAVAKAPSSDDAQPSAATPSPTSPGPRPTPRPTPRPVPRPIPRPAQAPVAAAGVPAAPVPPPQDAAEAAHAATFGRVDEEGTVYVREASGERAVGQFPGATADEALALYVRRYLDLHAKVVLFEARLGSADLAVKEVDQTLAKLTEELTEPAAVGDLDGLRSRLDALRSIAAERRAAAEAERAAAKEAAVVARTAIVEQAEKVAGTDPERIQWRPAGEQLRVLLDQWKDAQRNGPRIDRPTEESLWKRFSHARTTFDRERRHFFAELESRNASARAAKEALVAQAEKLSTSTDWGATAGAYRDLMAQWKASGRASRKEDDALWARFRAAQDTFFAARDAASAETDAEFRANLEVKERLLVEAEKILPIRDLTAAKAALRSVQDRWDAAGKVPRGDLQRVEGRLRAVENTVRDADQSAWTRGNPETRARAEGAAAQLESAIAGLEADLTAAKAAGDAGRIAEAQAALDARRAWLEQVRRAAQGS